MGSPRRPRTRSHAAKVAVPSSSPRPLPRPQGRQEGSRGRGSPSHRDEDGRPRACRRLAPAPLTPRAPEGASALPLRPNTPPFTPSRLQAAWSSAPVSLTGNPLQEGACWPPRLSRGENQRVTHVHTGRPASERSARRRGVSSTVSLLLCREHCQVSRDPGAARVGVKTAQKHQGHTMLPVVSVRKAWSRVDHTAIKSEILFYFIF